MINCCSHENFLHFSVQRTAPSFVSLTSRALRLFAPRSPFSPETGSTRPGAPQLLPDLDRKLATVFRSPATAALSSLHSRVNAPDLLLRSPADRFHRPFGSRLHALTRLAPDACASLPPARCGFCCPHGLPLPGLHCPSGVLPPSGSKRSAGFAASQPAFRFRPISVRSPPPFFYY
jgi:hypothetical protein